MLAPLEFFPSVSTTWWFVDQNHKMLWSKHQDILSIVVRQDGKMYFLSTNVNLWELFLVGRMA